MCARRSKQAVADRFGHCVFYLHSFQNLMHKRGSGKDQEAVAEHQVATHRTRAFNLLTAAELLQPVCAKGICSTLLETFSKTVCPFPTHLQFTIYFQYTAIPADILSSKLQDMYWAIADFLVEQFSMVMSKNFESRHCPRHNIQQKII